MSTSQITRPRLLEPGLFRRDPTRERYRVRGGGAIFLPLTAGDRMTITDVEGGQRCELAVFAPSGKEDAAALGARPDSRCESLAALLVDGSEDAELVLASMRQRGIVAQDARAVQLFGGETRPGAQESFTAQRDVLCIVGAPGKTMGVDEQDPPTELSVMVQRARVRKPTEMLLPPPLVEPRLDTRVQRMTAVAYEVKAGEYIQVIDVAGRQCSDFLAFEARSLQRGVERGLDSTATRTLMGAAYPTPGLY